MFDTEYNLFVLLSDDGDLEFYLDPTI